MWFFQVLPCRVLAKSPSIQGTCGLCGLQTHEKVEKLEPMRWLFSSEVMRNSGQKQKNTTSHEIYDPWIFRSWTWALLEHPGMPWTYQPRDSRTSLLALLGWMRQSSFSGATRVTHGPTGLSWMVLSTIGGTTGKSCCWIRGFRVHWSPGRSDFLEILGNPLDLQAHFPLKFLDWNQPNDWSSLADTGRLKFESPLQMKHLHQSSLTATASTTGSN